MVTRNVSNEKFITKNILIGSRKKLFNKNISFWIQTCFGCMKIYFDIILIEIYFDWVKIYILILWKYILSNINLFWLKENIF